MLRYLGPKLKTLKSFNSINTNMYSNLKDKTYRLVGGLNWNTIKNTNIKLNDFKYMFLYKYKSFIILKKFKQPDWSFFEVPDIFYDDISYYSSVESFESDKIIDLVVKKLGLDTYENKILSKLALDLIIDSVSLVDTISEFLLKTGIIFMPFYESVFYFSSIVFSFIGNVVSLEDNFFATLNSTIFNGGSFCFIPKNIKCNINVSTYFRTHSENFAQFERTLLIVEESSYLNYTEGCSAPIFSESQLHIALVELIVKKKAILNYSTLQNWYHGDSSGEGGIYNFTTKRGWCFEKSTLDWVQIELGSAITWKYPSSYLIGKNSLSNFFSLSLVFDNQIADTGNKMMHIGSFSKSRVYSKSVSLNNSIYSYRGLVKVFKKAKNVYNYTECNSLIIGDKTNVVTIPYTIVNSDLVFINQEASISKLESDFIFLLLQRGITLKTALNLLIYGFCQNICSKLPLDLELEIPLLILARTQSNF